MVSVGKGLALGVAALVVLLGLVEAAVGLNAFALAFGLCGGIVVCLSVARGTSGVGELGPADAVTLSRAVLACLLTALVAQSFTGAVPVPLLVGIAVTALVLDAVDGVVARRTRTSSPFGARFDGEVDAFLILILSVYVARSYGVWVLAIGVARYAFAATGWMVPRLRAQLPPRYWRKVVAATQGVVLTVAVADVGPRTATYAAVVVAAALLAESFGRDVLWLCRHGSPSRVMSAV